MPKRSNDFQSLIKFIYDRITPETGTVTESAMVYDKDATTLREVDILIEHKLSGHDIKIAIECRDRARKDTVEWIDGLIGKISSLDVHKVVAISKKGFTETAVAKAESHGIDTLSLETASDKDWESIFIKPGLLLISNEKFSLHDVIYEKDNEYRQVLELGMGSIVEFKGIEAGSVKGFFEWVFKDFIVPQSQKYINDHRMELFKNREDCMKTVYIEKGMQFDELYVIGDKGETTQISKVKFIIYGTRNVSDVKQEHSLFNEKMISVGEHIDVDGSIIKSRILQDPDTQNLHASILKELKKKETHNSLDW